MTAPRWFTFLGAALGFLAVAAGAFGAHALRSQVTPDRLAVFETAVRYQMYHAIGLFICAWLTAQGWRLAPRAGWLFVLGVVLFSGSLYLLVLTGVTAFGIITPLGGAAFLGGWLLLAICAWPFRAAGGAESGGARSE